jgi:succinyl-CoA synthetase alpha subunit
MLNLPENCRILIHGIEQPAAAGAIALMAAPGPQIVAGIGHAIDLPIPTFDLVEQAQAAQGHIDVAILFNPPWQILDAALEAMTAGIRNLVITTKGVPPLDCLQILRYSQRMGTIILGSGSAGIVAPDRLLLGCFDRTFFNSGHVGLIGRSESLIYEVAAILKDWKLGQSIAIHLGSDSILGSTASTWLDWLGNDAATQSIVLIGDIPRDEELESTARRLGKKVVAYHPHLNGSLAPPSDAAQLLRAARRSRALQRGSEVPMMESEIVLATSIQQLPNLLALKSLVE